MAKKDFNYQFEDIRRADTPVTAAGFGDMVEEPENPDEAFVDVDLDVDDPDKAVSTAENDADAIASAKNKDGDDKTGKDQRRQALETRRTKDRADKLEKDLAEGRTEFAGEVNALKKEVADLKADKEIGAIETEYASKEEKLTAEMEQAMEDGDSKAQSHIHSQLIAINSEKQAKKAAAEASVTIIEDLDADRDRTEQPSSQRAVQFIRDNESWWTDPDHEDAEDYSRKLDAKLVSMGFNPESDAYWNRFNHNFDKKFPDLRVKDPDDINIDLDLDDPAKRGRRKSPVSQPGGAGAARRTDGANGKGGSKVRLTAAHKANMSRFGLDPTNPEHCANYAREVKASQDKEDARRAS